MMYKDAEMITGGVFDCQCNETFTLIRADQSLYRFLGYTQKEFSDIYQNQLFYAIHEEERSKILEEIGRQVQKDGVFMYENRLKCKDGILKWIWISAQLNKNECNEPYFHCIFHDITESKKIQEALLISEKRLQFILSQTQDIVFEYDCKTNEIYYSDNLEKKYGYKIPVKGFPDSMFASNIIHKDDILPLRNGFQSILHGKEEMSCEYRLKYRNKGYRWVYAQATGLRDDKNNIIKIIGVITDIHDQKQELLKSREEAALDPLTGLFNRRECIRRIENYIAVNDAPFAFILIDVDDFKMINDVYGHAKGDEALIRVGVEISSIIRKNDLTARIGGDEFVICLMNIPDRQIAINKVELIQDIFGESLRSELGYQINCSIGISFYPDDGNDFETLLEHADIAMYQSKKNGKNQFQIYQGEGVKKAYAANPQKYMQKSFHDHIIEYVMRILLENQNREQAITEILELIGKIFDCDRITLYQNQEGSLYVSKAWYSDPMYNIDDTELLIADKFISNLDNGKKICTFTNIKNISDPELLAWFMNRMTIACVVCIMMQHSTLHGLICFEDCHGFRNASGEERYTLKTISDLLQLYLFQER